MEKGRRDTVLLTVIAIATLLVAVVGATFAYFTARLTNVDRTSTITIGSSNGGVLTFTGGATITMNNIYPRGGNTIAAGDPWVTKPFMVSYSNVNGNYETRYNLTLVYTNTFGENEIYYSVETTAGYCQGATDKTTSEACNGNGTWHAMSDGGVKLTSDTTLRALPKATTTQTITLPSTEADDVGVFQQNTNWTANGTSTLNGNDATLNHTYVLKLYYPYTNSNQNYQISNNTQTNETNHGKVVTAYVRIDEAYNNDMSRTPRYTP